MTMQDFDQNGFPKLDSPFVKTNRQIEIPWYRLLITLWNRTGGSSGTSGVQSGMTMDWAGPESTIPIGWLICDGSSVSRNTYATLFSAIGTTWGAIDAQSFNLPNLIGRYRKGSAVAGVTGGNDSIIFDITQLPPHAHAITDPGHAHVIADPGHTHAQNVVNSGTAGAVGTQGANTADTTLVGTTGSSVTGAIVNSATTGITSTDDTGGGDAVDINPPFATLVPIIKV